MIEGVVNAAYETRITIAIGGPSGVSRTIEAEVDTGSDGFLTLTPGLIAELGLPYVTSGVMAVVGQRVVETNLHRVTVLLDGREIKGIANSANTTPLIGMRLLEGYDLHVEVKVGGRVRIEPSTA